MGKFLMLISTIALFIIDLLSLYALNLQHGIFWAIVAFFVVPLQLFVPFLVGTWPAAIAFAALLFLGGFLDQRREARNG